MKTFEKNLNIFGINEPLLYPVERPDREPITIAEYLYLFFEFSESQVLIKQLEYEETYEIRNLIQGCQGDIEENFYIVSSKNGEKFPRASRSLSKTHNNYRKIFDPQGARAFRNFIERFGNIVDLNTIIGCGGEVEGKIRMVHHTVICFCDLS